MIGQPNSRSLLVTQIENRKNNKHSPIIEIQKVVEISKTTPERSSISILAVHFMFITSFCEHLPHYHQGMASIFSQRNRVLSNRSVN